MFYNIHFISHVFLHPIISHPPGVAGIRLSVFAQYFFLHWSVGWFRP